MCLCWCRWIDWNKCRKIKNNSVKDYEKGAVTDGGSGSPILVVDVGSEVSLGKDIEPIYNFSLGISSSSPVPMETHLYKTTTEVKLLWSNRFTKHNQLVW